MDSSESGQHSRSHHCTDNNQYLHMERAVRGIVDSELDSTNLDRGVEDNRWRSLDRNIPHPACISVRQIYSLVLGWVRLT